MRLMYGLDSAFPPSFYFQAQWRGWRFILTFDEEPMFGIEHPDGRFFGFWTEDFQFDVHRAMTAEEKAQARASFEEYCVSVGEKAEDYEYE